ncbi:DUF4012 domain-containing protein [Nakamurella flavida]|uniref:DUF4012 domain-containing protein n=1 Tax=Nakamurella flavida TaxID=363630 RepID=A0A939C692_9ACTN|nr:DUF4012 domain-containing protein [Nakamurella flavida]MBM9477779.1 DUF4012 domain-containing protein [Nakamurella flavida]MDP9779332.1 hypothetical protein [Nakamurella flavida]
MPQEHAPVDVHGRHRDGVPPGTVDGSPRPGVPAGADERLPGQRRPPDGSVPPPRGPGADRFAVTSYVPPVAGVTFAGKRAPDPSAAAPVTPTPALDVSESRPSRRRIVLLSALGLLVVLVAVGGWVGWRTWQAYTHLTAAAQEVSRAQDLLTDISSVDPVATASVVRAVQVEAAAARAAVDDPLFRLVTLVPVVGDNLDAIREITLTVDGLSTGVMPSLVQVAGALSPADLAPRDGRIELAPLEQLAPVLQQADVAVQASRARVGAIDRGWLVGSVDQAVTDLGGRLDDAAEVTVTAARASRLLPPMLGASGPRTYLVAFQNPAQPRATGGVFGSYAVVRVDGGEMTIVGQGAPSTTLGFFDRPVVPVSADQQGLFTDALAQDPRDANTTADFPTAAALFATMYTQRTGTTVDGVLATDPVALSYMLAGTGPVDVGDGVVLTADNAVPLLLSEPGAAQGRPTVSAAERDDFLARATGRAFSAVTEGTGDADLIMAGLARAAAERRVLVWSAATGEQEDLAATSVAGSLGGTGGVGAPAAALAPSLGVFLNETTGSKLGFYLDNQASLVPGECRTDGRRSWDVAVTVNDGSPPAGLPASVLGTGAQPYRVGLQLLLYAPTGSSVQDATVDSVAVAVAAGTDSGRPVTPVAFDVGPGESRTVVFRVVTAADGSTGPPALVLSPGVNPWVTTVDGRDPCAVPAG